jgi:DNA ligase-1
MIGNTSYNTSNGGEEDMMFPTLYSKGKKNEIRIWNIRTLGDTIITLHGVVGGKQQRSEKTVNGKNIGRANETTPIAQAVLEASSMWKKKKDKGYFESIEEAENTQVFLPMLAAKYKDRKKKVKFPVTVQPKMDGVRALAYWDWIDNEVKLLSRGGKYYNIKHLSEQIALFLKPGQVLDGEVYIHGLARQDINKLVKKHREKPTKDLPFCSRDLELWIYDSFFDRDTDHPWIARRLILKYLKDTLKDYSNFKVVQDIRVDQHKDILSIHKGFVARGFEGVIIREDQGTYELADRSNHLMKYKEFQDEEFKIIGFTDGVGKFKNCVTWICETPAGREFNVTPKGTLKEKRKMFEEADKYIGQWLTVQFQSYSNDKIPEFPVGIGTRLREDM